MTKKRRKQRPGPRPSSRPRAPAVAEGTGRRSDAPGFLSWLAPRSSDTPFPPIGRSLARGAVAAGSSAAVLLLSFGFVFLGWLGMVALGLEGPPGRMVDLAALPPVSTYFDALDAITIFGFGITGLLVSMGFMLVRAIFVAALAGMVVQRLEGEGTPVEGVLRGLRAYPVVLAANIMGMSLMLAGSVILPFFGAGLGFLGSILILVAALFFFAFAPAAAIREGRGLMDTLRRSGRAALMPGSRHLLMCLLYIFLALPLLVALAPGGSLLTVNPSFAMWAYALLATFVHVAFLAAFCYRWMVVEDRVPEEPVKVRRR